MSLNAAGCSFVARRAEQTMSNDAPFQRRDGIKTAVSTDKGSLCFHYKKPSIHRGDDRPLCAGGVSTAFCNGNRVNLYPWIRPFLFHLDAETAHHLTLSALRAAQRSCIMQRLETSTVHAPRTVMGLRFDNAVGLAAGLDKDGLCIDG